MPSVRALLHLFALTNERKNMHVVCDSHSTVDNRITRGLKN